MENTESQAPGTCEGDAHEEGTGQLLGAHTVLSLILVTAVPAPSMRPALMPYAWHPPGVPGETVAAFLNQPPLTEGP